MKQPIAPKPKKTIYTYDPKKGALNPRDLAAKKEKEIADKIIAGIDLNPNGKTITTPKTTTGGTKTPKAVTPTDNTTLNLLQDYIKRTQGNVASDLASAKTYDTQQRTALTDRYNQYNTNLNSNVNAANAAINASGAALQSYIPQTATPVAAPVFQQPAAASNPYQQYLSGMGVNTNAIAGLQGFNTANAQAANDLAVTGAAQQTAAQQSYLDSLRNTAAQAQAAASQRVAMATPAYKNAALGTYNAGLGNLDKLLGGSNNASTQANQTLMDQLLPYFLADPKKYGSIIGKMFPNMASQNTFSSMPVNNNPMGYQVPINIGTL